MYSHWMNLLVSFPPPTHFVLKRALAVCGFEAFINGKHIVGEVKEKEKAHKEYKEAIQAGHGAYLMDEGIFCISHLTYC